jgi:DNA-binding CsgD family transcriptional regulator
MPGHSRRLAGLRGPGVPGGYWPERDGDRLLQAWDRRIVIVMRVPVQRLYCAGWGCQPGRVRPRIRYCSTPAGRVAYSTSAAGPALLCDSGWITHLRGQLELCSFGDFVGRLAERFTVIRYDKPGCGLSDRDGIDLSFDGQVAAALAVADAMGADRFRLFGASQGGQLAAAIAARYPERVEALLPAVQARTTVLHRESDKGTRFELGREVAALIPGATLIPLPGSSHLFYHGDWPSVLEAMLGFLCEPVSPGPRLTGRELEVAELVAGGLTNQSIARRLSIAPRTAEAHVENIRRKLQVHSRAQIAAWVTEHRLRPARLGSSPDVRAAAERRSSDKRQVRR